MKFESVKCDSCGKIQDAANHWIKMAAHYSIMSTASAPATDDKPSLVAMGMVEENSLILGHSVGLAGMREINVILDLCGQQCAFKMLAKLLGWSTPGAAE